MKRRIFLKSSLACLALPGLETFASNKVSEAKAKRLICIGHWLGLYTPQFFPKEAGKNYKVTPLLKAVDSLRSDYSVFSGMDHRCSHGHKSWNNFLCGTEGRTVSVDQIIAGKLGHNTRFKSLELTCGRKPAESAMNITESGVVLPMIDRPSVLFNKLFASSADIARRKYEMDSGRSVLDNLLKEAADFKKRVSGSDRQKLNQYFDSVRSVEKNIQKRRVWLERPVRKTDYKVPEVDPIAAELLLDCEKIMFDLIGLAMETDQTRVCTYLGGGDGQVFTIDGKMLSTGYHGLSHHGNNPNRVEEFVRVNNEQMKNLARLLQQLKEKKDEAGRPLLDTTIVYFGSGLGNANVHNTNNVPVLVAGGGFKHGCHHRIDREAKDAPVLGQLFVTMMQQLGLDKDSFAYAKGHMNEYMV